MELKIAVVDMKRTLAGCDKDDREAKQILKATAEAADKKIAGNWTRMKAALELVKKVDEQMANPALSVTVRQLKEQEREARVAELLSLV